MEEDELSIGVGGLDDRTGSATLDQRQRVRWLQRAARKAEGDDR